MKFKIDIPKAVAIMRSWGSVHSPAICTGTGIALGVVTVATAVKATPKALYLIEERKKELQKEKLTTLETVQAAWEPYILPATTGIVSGASILLGQRISSRRVAALSAALSMSESAYSEYQDKVKEVFGKNKEQGVRDKIAQDTVDSNPVEESDIFCTGKGDTLFYDATSGRYFKSDLELIRRGINNVNYEMMNGMCMWACLNDIYQEWGLRETAIGDDIGWNMEDGLIEIRPISTMIADNGKPCIVLEFTKHPRYEFNKLY